MWSLTRDELIKMCSCLILLAVISDNAMVQEMINGSVGLNTCDFRCIVLGFKLIFLVLNERHYF